MNVNVVAAAGTYCGLRTLLRGLGRHALQGQGEDRAEDRLQPGEPFPCPTFTRFESASSGKTANSVFGRMTLASFWKSAKMRCFYCIRTS